MVDVVRIRRLRGDDAGLGDRIAGRRQCTSPDRSGPCRRWPCTCRDTWCTWRGTCQRSSAFRRRPAPWLVAVCITRIARAIAATLRHADRRPTTSSTPQQPPAPFIIWTMIAGCSATGIGGSGGSTPRCFHLNRLRASRGRELPPGRRALVQPCANLAWARRRRTPERSAARSSERTDSVRGRFPLTGRSGCS